MLSWRDLPGAPRAIGAAVTQAVDAATAGDREAYESAAAAVVALPAHQTGIVLGAVVRSLIEDQHPDGLDGDDIRAVLGDCLRATLPWLGAARVDVSVLIAVLASALGIHEAGVTYVDPNPAPTVSDDLPSEYDGTPPEATGRPPTPAEYAFHAPLLLADLLRRSAFGLSPYLDAAFTEIARGEQMDMP